MAADDFNESKYTEAAWSSIITLTKAADYYQATSVEAPLLLDIMLNPNKHNAGDDADAAKRVVEKTLLKAGVDIGKLRSALEQYLAKQPRVSGSSGQKSMSQSLMRVLDAAKRSKEILGVSPKY